MISIETRPYILTFPATGESYPLSSEEVRRLAAEHHLIAVGARLLVLCADGGQHFQIRPATLDSARCFTRVGD